MSVYVQQYIGDQLVVVVNLGWAAEPEKWMRNRKNGFPQPEKWISPVNVCVVRWDLRIASFLVVLVIMYVWSSHI